MRRVQWAPSGNSMDGTPGEIVKLLATADGKTFGYGHGPEWSTGFNSEQGIIFVNPGQWVARYDDGRITVTDTDPFVCTECGGQLRQLSATGYVCLECNLTETDPR